MNETKSIRECKTSIRLVCAKCDEIIFDYGEEYKIEVENGQIITTVPICQKCYGQTKHLLKKIAELYRDEMSKEAI